MTDRKIHPHSVEKLQTHEKGTAPIQRQMNHQNQKRFFQQVCL